MPRARKPKAQQPNPVKRVCLWQSGSFVPKAVLGTLAEQVGQATQGNRGAFQSLTDIPRPVSIAAGGMAEKSRGDDQFSYQAKRNSDSSRIEKKHRRTGHCVG